MLKRNRGRVAPNPSGGDTQAKSIRMSGKFGLFRRFSPLSMLVVILGVAVVATTLLHMQAKAGLPPEVFPRLILKGVPAGLQDGYLRTGSFVGRLQPARKTELAFERGGLVLKVLRKEGESVKAGDAVAILDTSKLKASKRQMLAQRRALEAQSKLSKATLTRKKRLRKKGWGTEQHFDEAGANYAELKASTEQIDAEINALDIDIRKSTLIAPFDGVISSRLIHEGAVVGIGTPVATLLEDGRRQVRIGLPPDVAQNLDPDREYKLTAGRETVYGRLAVLRPDLQTDTHTVTTIMDVFGAENIPFGELVTLNVDTKVNEAGIWLPLTALTEGSKGLWNVMIAEQEDNGSVVRKEVVEVLYAKDQRVFVRGSFADNALIVVNGTNSLTSGQLVSIAKN